MVKLNLSISLEVHFYQQKQFEEKPLCQNKYHHIIQQIVKSITFMVRVHQEKVLRKGIKVQAEESFAKLAKISRPVSALIKL